jgi:hypothetical protein
MTFLPIVWRELRVAARRRETYRLRTISGALVVLLGTACYLIMRGDGAPAKEVSMALFCTLTGGAVFVALTSGSGPTADCLSREKREGTLGLLFLTDLKGYDVVLGKLVASSLNMMYCLLAIVPVLAVPLLMGGITQGEFLRMALVAINSLFFSLTLGVCISALCRSVLAAGIISALIVFFFTALLPALGLLLSQLTRSWPVKPVFLLPSAGCAYFLALDRNYRSSADAFWISVAVVHGMGWVSLVLASLIAPRAWQERPAGANGFRWLTKARTLRNSTAGETGASHRDWLDQNAYFWLAARSRLRPAAVWAVLGLLACCWLVGLVRYRRDWFNEVVYVLTAVGVNLLLKTWFAFEAARQLAEDRQTGTLELLLSTPLSVRDILKGQMLALFRQFLAPLGAVLALEAIFMAAGLSNNYMVGEDRSLWVLFWSAMMVMLVADLAALYWVGLWQGLTAPNALRGGGNALARIFIIPWGVILLVLAAVALASMGPGPAPDLGARFYLGLWFFLGLATDISFATTARTNLLTRFRRMAAERYIRPEGFWKRWLPL